MDRQAWDQTEAAFLRLQHENEREEARRRREIAEMIPEADKLLTARHEMILSSVRSAFRSAAGQNPEETMRAYNEKIAALLTSRGYPADYLSPVCRCPVCGDTGFVYDQGVRRPCACFLQAYQAALGETGGGETFASFDESRFPASPLPGTDVTQREYMRVVRDRCALFARGVPEGPIKTLLLHGSSGLGKTFLLHCVADAAREKGVDTLCVTAYDLLMDLKSAYFSRTGETASEYFDAALLLIDDLGMEPLIENVTVEQIYNLLNARLSRGLYTAVSTNLSREELGARYTERVASRLLDTRNGMALHLQGKDIRLLR